MADPVPRRRQFRKVDILSLVIFASLWGLIVIWQYYGVGGDAIVISILTLFAVFVLSIVFGCLTGLIEVFRAAHDGKVWESLGILVFSVLLPGLFILICLAAWYLLKYYT